MITTMYSDLRAISKGYDPSAVLAVGGECFLTEAVLSFGTNAHKQARAINHSEELKQAKRLMSEGSKLAKSDAGTAASKYKEAITILKKLRKDAENIEDDILEEVYSENLFKSFAALITSAVVTAIGVLSDVKRITTAVKALGSVRSIKGAIGGIKAVGSAVGVMPSWLTIVGITALVLSFIYQVKVKEDFNKQQFQNFHTVNGKRTDDHLNNYVDGYHISSDTRDEVLARIDRMIISCEDCVIVLQNTR